MLFSFRDDDLPETIKPHFRFVLCVWFPRSPIVPTLDWIIILIFVLPHKFAIKLKSHLQSHSFHRAGSFQVERKLTVTNPFTVLRLVCSIADLLT